MIMIKIKIASYNYVVFQITLFTTASQDILPVPGTRTRKFNYLGYKLCASIEKTTLIFVTPLFSAIIDLIDIIDWLTFKKNVFNFVNSCLTPKAVDFAVHLWYQDK